MTAAERAISTQAAAVSHAQLCRIGTAYRATSEILVNHQVTK